MATNELYSRQETLQLTTPQAIIVVGCGGIGGWVAIFAAMSGVQRIYLFDADVLEESNRNRLPFCQGALNQPKVEVVANFIRGIRSGCVVLPMQVRLTTEILNPLMANDAPVVIDCTDSPKTQIELYNNCKSRRYRYIRAGYDGTRIMVTSNVSGWIKKESVEETYQINPSWVVPSVTVAAIAVAKLMLFENQEVGLDISEIGVPALERMKRMTARCTQSKSTPEVPRRRRTTNGTQE